MSRTWQLLIGILCLLHALCSTIQASATVAPDASDQPPVMSAGHMNASCSGKSSTSLPKVIKSKKGILLGITATSCRHCRSFEPHYAEAADSIKELGGKFVRVDMDGRSCQDWRERIGVEGLPAIKWCKKGKCFHYHGKQTAPELSAFVAKQLKPPFETGNSFDSVKSFMNAHDVSVVAFLSESDEDDFEDFKDSAKMLQARHNVFFMAVQSKKAAEAAVQAEWAERFPCIVLSRNLPSGGVKRSYLSLAEGSETSLSKWISSKSLLLVDELTGENFKMYEDLRLPMGIMFLNSSSEASDASAKAIAELELTAAHFLDKMVFVWASSESFGSRMVTLGLKPNIFPSFALNTMDGHRYALDQDVSVTQFSLRKFCDSFLKGQLEPVEIQRKKRRLSKPKTAQYGSIVELEAETLETFIQNTRKDVVVMFYVSGSSEHEIFIKHWRKAADRLEVMNISSVMMGQFDVGTHTPPNYISTDKLPSIMMAPANDKVPPFRYYHGKGKVRPFMNWLPEVASIPIHFENDTPDLDAEMRKAYEEQMAEREQRLKEKQKNAKNEL